MMTDSIIQDLMLVISDITGYSYSIIYAYFYNLIKDIKVKLSAMPPQSLNNIKKQIYLMHTVQDKDIKIDSLKEWLIYFYHNPDIVEHIMKDIIPAHIEIFNNQNSNESCKILSGRIIKECKRLYDNLDKFDIANLSLTLSTTTYEGMIKILKNLKSIGAVNTDAISFKYFLSNILNL